MSGLSLTEKLQILEQFILDNERLPRRFNKPKKALSKEDLKARKEEGTVYTIYSHYILGNKRKPPQDPEERKQFLALKQSITKLADLYKPYLSGLSLTEKLQILEQFIIDNERLPRRFNKPKKALSKEDLKTRKEEGAVYTIYSHYILRNKIKPPQNPEERKQFLALKQRITKLAEPYEKLKQKKQSSRKRKRPSSS